MQELPVDVIGLDFVWGKANWDALGDTKFEKKLGAGIVDARGTRLESEAEIAERIERLAKHLDAYRIYVNPSSGLEYLPRETAFEKLKIMVEGARKAEGVSA
jgi:5-methyltetrahydropteroyltriglutamate--homocysteine methyltransferase